MADRRSSRPRDEPVLIAAGALLFTVDQFARDDCPFEVTCPCQFAVRSEIATPKPRVLSIPGAQGGTRTLIVMNMGPQAETANYRVMLTPTALSAGSTYPDPAAGQAMTGKKGVLRR